MVIPTLWNFRLTLLTLPLLTFSKLVNGRFLVIVNNFIVSEWLFDMNCEYCHKVFATKYTLKRHMAQVHSESFDTTTDSIKSESESTNGESTVPLQESNGGDNSDPEEPMDSDSEEPTTEDFWTLLIRATVKQIYYQRIAAGLPVPIPDVDSAEELLEGKAFNQIFHQMRKTYSEHSALHNAAIMDCLLDIILSQSGSMFEDYDTRGEDQKDYDEQAEILAWKKYKFLIMKKVQNNLEEFDILVGEKSDAESEELE